MKKLILALIVSAAPAAAQTTVRVPVSGISAIPGLGAAFDGARLGAAPLLMPTLSPGMQMPALSALALTTTLTPALVQPAAAAGILAAAAKPVVGSPLGVIRDASANEAEKTAALDRLFENSAPSSPEALSVSGLSAALTPESSNEFSQAPPWFDASQLKFDALVKSGTGGTAVMRYGWRNQLEMSVFVFPGSASVSFKEYSANPMGKPKQSLEASLQKAPSRAMAAQILRAVQARNPVSGKDKATLDAILALLSTLVHDRSQGVPDQASALAPPRGRTRDNKIAFDFTSLDPTSRYFLGTHPIQIQNLGGGSLEMTVVRNEESYVVRYLNGVGVEVLKDGIKAPAPSALRGLQEMLMVNLQSGALRDPLYARMLEEIRAALAPAYVPGTPDPLWRYLWKFRYSKVNPTVAYYAGYRTGTVATPRDGAIEMVLRRDASKIILTWRTGSGFKAKREDGFVFTPNKSDLRGMQLSLMNELLETGSPGPLTSTLLQKFRDAVGD